MQRAVLPLRRPVAPRRGGALIVCLLAVATLAAMVAVVAQVSVTTKKQVEYARQETRAFYLAEAGIADTVAAFTATIESGAELPAQVGSLDAPLLLNGGSYWVAITPNADDTWTVVSRGEANGSVRALEAVIASSGSAVFEHALFAGNSSGDPNYTLTLGGSGSQADEVIGDVYSGGDASVGGTAGVTGTLRATGSILGGSGEEGISQPIPDLVGMDYPNNCDVDVREEFADGGATYESNALGGSAWQLPESSPAHFFRMNPSDRTAATVATAKDDYFMEDPYEPLKGDASSDGSDACPITLPGTNGEPGPSGNKKIYFVDGNLWLHNPHTMSFQLLGEESTGAQVTFVVKGNIYFSDNLFYADKTKDAALFIAIEDPAVADSGNIYFGDPAFGTLEQMHAFMYAENDFVDQNLDAAGSATVRVYGNMSAGNHVRIERDYVSGGDVQHSKLTVDLDTRILDGSLDLPGMPASGAGKTTAYQVVSWRDLSIQ